MPPECVCNLAKHVYQIARVHFHTLLSNRHTPILYTPFTFANIQVLKSTFKCGHSGTTDVWHLEDEHA